MCVFAHVYCNALQGREACSLRKHAAVSDFDTADFLSVSVLVCVCGCVSLLVYVCV